MTDKTKAPEPGAFCSTCGAFYSKRPGAAAFDKENLPNAKREPTVGELAARIDEVAKQIGRMDGWVVKADSAYLDNVVRVNVALHDTQRRLSLVSESCAEARKEARQARWLAYMAAAVALGLLCGLVIGKVA